MSIRLVYPDGINAVSLSDGTQLVADATRIATVAISDVSGLLSAGFTLAPEVGSASVRIYDDFVGAQAAIGTSAAVGTPWVKKIAGAGPPTVAGVANAAGGAVAISLEATSEKQDAVLYAGDQLNFVPGKGIVFEARVKLSTLPTAGSKLVFGMAGVWADGQDAMLYSAWFAASGSGEIFAESDDNTTDTSVTTGVTVLATDYHTYRIDLSNTSDVKFYIDGVEVAAATTFAEPTAAHQLQPYLSAYKASGTSVGAMTVDYVRITQSR